jgi:hypothetical protein
LVSKKFWLYQVVGDSGGINSIQVWDDSSQLYTLPSVGYGIGASQRYVVLFKVQDGYGCGA